MDACIHKNLLCICNSSCGQVHTTCLITACHAQHLFKLQLLMYLSAIPQGLCSSWLPAAHAAKCFELLIMSHSSSLGSGLVKGPKSTACAGVE